jgi:hypothetical protein
VLQNSPDPSGRKDPDLEVVDPVVLVGDMPGGIAGEQKAFR